MALAADASFVGLKIAHQEGGLPLTMSEAAAGLTGRLPDFELSPSAKADYIVR